MPEPTISFAKATGRFWSVHRFMAAVRAANGDTPFLVPNESVKEAQDDILSTDTDFILYEGHTAGVITFSYVPHTYEAELDLLLIRPKFWRRGIAEAALRAKMAKLPDLLGLNLLVHPTNVGAIALYKKVGFQIEGSVVEMEYGPRLIMTCRPTRKALTEVE